VASDDTPTVAALSDGEQGARAGDYLRALRRRWWIPIVTGAIAMTAAVLVSLNSAKQYDATAAILFTNSEPIDTLLSTSSSRSLDPERDLNTGVALVRLDSVARRVKSDLHSPLTVRQLLDEVHAAPQGNSNVIEITARDRSPHQAAAIANAFALRYVGFRRSSAREQYNEAGRLAQAQLQALKPDQRTSVEGRSLEARLHELQIASALQTGGVQFVENAKAPTSAATPRPLRNGLVGLLVGLFIGCLAAVGLEFNDRRLKTEDDAEHLVGLPVLARVPRVRGGPDRVASEGGEAFATAALSLRLGEGVEPPETVLVTSTQAGEGKTTVSLGVGRALASLGNRVIVIEADLRVPSIARSLGLTRRPGLAAVLAGVRSLDDELVEVDPAPGDEPPTTQEQGWLAVLPAGSTVQNPHLLLSSDRMRALLNDARATADVVIIDAPAIGLVSDALTLTTALDTCVFVVGLNRATSDLTRRALKTLQDAGVPIAGVVITGTSWSPAYGYQRRPATTSDRLQHAPDVTFLPQREAATEKPE
jgi:polysaccharide biosynthesis transport protein